MVRALRDRMRPALPASGSEQITSQLTKNPTPPWKVKETLEEL